MSTIRIEAEIMKEDMEIRREHTDYSQCLLNTYIFCILYIEKNLFIKTTLSIENIDLQLEKLN